MSAKSNRITFVVWVAVIVIVLVTFRMLIISVGLIGTSHLLFWAVVIATAFWCFKDVLFLEPYMLTASSAFGALFAFWAIYKKHHDDPPLLSWQTSFTLATEPDLVGFRLWFLSGNVGSALFFAALMCLATAIAARRY